MMTAIWVVGAFLAGSIAFSVLIGRLALREDIRQYGDHNPGAANVMRAGGWRLGTLAIALDYLKGAIPVGLAWYGAGMDDWRIVPIALAPLMGHAFSPWLHWRGGKAVATTFGVWSGLTLGYVPTLLGLFLAMGFMLITVSGWAVVLAMLGVLAHLLLFHPDPLWLAVWGGNMLLLVWKHRQDLTLRPHLNPALVRLRRAE